MPDTIQMPRYPIPGYEDFTPEEAAELLHYEKNRPEGPPSAVLRKHTRPYAELSPEEKMFPHAMYREWSEYDRNMARHRAAARLNINLRQNDPIELETVDAFIGAYDSVNARNQADMDQKLAQGWCKSPEEAKRAAFLSHRELATDAAVSYTDDRGILSDKAMAERERIDDAAPDHIAEIPHTPIPAHQRKRGA